MGRRFWVGCGFYSLGGGGGEEDSSGQVLQSKLSVSQTPGLYSLPSKSVSNNINVPFTDGGNLVKESR